MFLKLITRVRGYKLEVTFPRLRVQVGFEDPRR
nr:MAG TPA: hypothetical protein [Caudoviricetes sp.]